MKFELQTSHESKCIAGVSFTIHRIGEMRRAQIELKCADAKSKQRDLSLEWRELSDEIESLYQPAPPIPANLSADELEALAIAERERFKSLPLADRKRISRLQLKITALDDQFSLLGKSEIEPVWIRGGLISIAGIDVGGKPLTTEQLIENGPRELATEVFTTIYREAYLSETDAKNSQPLSTSGAPEGGQMNPIIAPSVNGTEIMSSEIAVATSQGS